MIKRIKTSDLCRGMYVILPHLWLKEVFPENHFLITTEEELHKIHTLAAGEVSIDTIKGMDITPVPGRGETVPAEWDSSAGITERIRGIVADQKLSPAKKAGAVYDESMLLMQKLFESPTASAISESRQGVFHVVDLILSDNAVAMHMLGILSHDYYTYTHSVNVGVLSVSLARVIYGDGDKKKLQELGAGFFFHDLGKVMVDNAVINKRGRLTEKEMGEMRTHPYKGYEILEKAGFLTREAELIVLQHHERSDGRGYPRGLKGSEIHEYGRICSVADVFDALTSERSYHSSRTSYEALKLMREELLGHFERELFERFVLLFGEKAVPRQGA
ncbi:MAG: HD-GYP domain-containing protein [Thermodesulfobacteriota bacterium]